MPIIEIILIGIGLSFDTFAVSISAGLTVRSIRFWQGIRIAIILALFQAFMPFLGWLGGVQIVKHISHLDHWVAFGLLSLIGIKMIIDSFKKEAVSKFNPLLFRVLLVLGLATSIDALVVGFSLGFIEINIYQSMVIIGFTTFLAAMIGMLIGKHLTTAFGKQVELLGGLILIGIGIKILIEHLMGSA